MEALRRYQRNRVRGSLFLCLLVLPCVSCGEQPTPPNAAKTVLPAVAAAHQPEASMDNYNISQDEYRVNVGFIADGILRLGDGLDLSVPDAPKRRTTRAPLQLGEPQALKALPPEDFTLNEYFQLRQSTSAREESLILSAYFQGSYGFVSGEAALEVASKEHAESTSLFALLESRGEVRDLGSEMGGQVLQWREGEKPMLEDLVSTDEDLRRQFLLDYGSHYVAAITYGYRIGIRGKLKKNTSEDSAKISAAFNATFVAGSAEGGIDAEHRKTLSSSDLDLHFEATSGGLYENGERVPGIITDLDQIFETLQKLKDGTIKVRAAPLFATARTYWNLIPPEYSRSRALLNQGGDSPPPDPVVHFIRGAIISWSPPASAIVEDEEGHRRLVIPSGWALCDGTEGTPDLRNRFIYGTDQIDQIGKTGGETVHRHTVSVGNNTSSATTSNGLGGNVSLAKPDHAHTASSADAAHLPPLVKLVYLMKQ